MLNTTNSILKKPKHHKLYLISKTQCFTRFDFKLLVIVMLIDKVPNFNIRNLFIKNITYQHTVFTKIAFVS